MKLFSIQTANNTQFENLVTNKLNKEELLKIRGGNTGDDDTGIIRK